MGCACHKGLVLYPGRGKGQVQTKDLSLRDKSIFKQNYCLPSWKAGVVWSQYPFLGSGVLWLAGISPSQVNKEGED